MCCVYCSSDCFRLDEHLHRTKGTIGSLAAANRRQSLCDPSVVRDKAASPGLLLSYTMHHLPFCYLRQCSITCPSVFINNTASLGLLLSETKQRHLDFCCLRQGNITCPSVVVDNASSSSSSVRFLQSISRASAFRHSLLVVDSSCGHNWCLLCSLMEQ